MKQKNGYHTVMVRSQAFFSYAEQNEYRKHTLDKYFTACIADAAYRGLLICLRLSLELPREKSRPI